LSQSLWIAVIMGIVEGLTEYIPVSSTGHLIVTGALLGLQGEKAKTFEIFIQLGAILAVVVYYWRRFLRLLDLRQGNGRSFAGLRGCMLLAVTTFPVLAVGFLAHDFLKTYLFKPVPVAIALAVGALGILAAEQWRPAATTIELDGVTWSQALGVGLFQCLALWPGMSRSAATIVGGMMGRINRKTAAEYSFFAAVPALTAATLYDLYKSRALLAASDVPVFAVGFGVSFLAAWFAVAGFLRLLQHHTLRPFAYYRLLVAPIIYYFMRSY
jgi:undecaprenyl-diphosphatase